MKKRISQALNHAHKDTSHYLTSHLRQEASESKWPNHLVDSLKVEYKGDSFKPTIHEDHMHEALNYEYGTPDMRPTAAIRRAGNRTKEAEKFFVSRFMSHLGVK